MLDYKLINSESLEQGSNRKYGCGRSRVATGRLLTRKTLQSSQPKTWVVIVEVKRSG